MPQILVDNLEKRFRVAERDPGLWGAVRGLARGAPARCARSTGFRSAIEAGELVGYIGPNGAGKSTTVKIARRHPVPDGGAARCAAGCRGSSASRTSPSIGVVFGQRTQLWWDLPVVESFELLRDIYRVARRRGSRAPGRAGDRARPRARSSTPRCASCRLGQRMRCDLAAALLHAPPILFLDEPTIGLDAVSKLAVRDFVRRPTASAA